MTGNRGDKIIREQLGSVQISFDKEAAWERLHGRLETKTNSKKYYHFGWVAAALIILAGMLWQAIPVKQPPVVTKAQPKLAAPNNNEQLTIATTPGIIEANEQIATLPAPEQQKKYDTKDHIAVGEPEIQQPLVVDVIQEPAIEEKEVPIVAAKPKMKVMHINDVLEEEKVERRVLNSRYADNKHYDRPYYRSFEDNSNELRNPFKIYISTQN